MDRNVQINNRMLTVTRLLKKFYLIELPTAIWNLSVVRYTKGLILKTSIIQCYHYLLTDDNRITVHNAYYC